jgi:hypothetical protein
VDDSLVEFLDMAEEMVVTGEAVRMLVGKIIEDKAMYFVIDSTSEGSVLCSLSEARQIAASTQDISDILRQFANLKLKKGIA